jgi:hypothetical protein
MRKRWIVGSFGAVALFLAGCGGGDSVTVYGNPPVLTVTYTTPSSPTPVTVKILSDLASNGDIAFDPVQSSYTVTQGPSSIWFGFDSANQNVPEYRAFLTFPLDGITGQPVVPPDALIDSADVQVFVDFLDFVSTLPTYLDLVLYPPAYGGFNGLGSLDPSADFNQPYLATRPVFDFLASDAGNFVRIEVTSLMQAALLDPPLPDFQLRFSTAIVAPGLVGLNNIGTSVQQFSPKAPSRSSGRSVIESPHAGDGVVPRQQPATVKRLYPTGVPARGR